MIMGTGIDIVELKRIEAVALKHKGFVKRILTPAEQSKFEQLSHTRQIEFLAGRFAAKEAFAKAVGSGIGKHLSWQDVEILPDEHGKPFVKCSRDVGHVHLSISHSKQYAVANVIIESM